MTDNDLWQPLHDELARWINASRSVRFWLRDDDACEPTGSLTKLLKLGAAHSLPLTLAVIPAHAGEALADELADAELITVAVHGWSHENYAGSDEKKQELGPHRPSEIVLGELGNGVSRLKALFPRRFVPVLVPPWNRIEPTLVPQLPKLGFEAISTFGEPKSKQTAYLPAINTHVDLMDWHGTRGCRDHGELVAAIVKQLQQRFDDGGDTVGILTHHLVHDGSAWDFLGALFEATAGNGGCRWVSVRELL